MQSAVALGGAIPKRGVSLRRHAQYFGQKILRGLGKELVPAGGRNDIRIIAVVQHREIGDCLTAITIINTTKLGTDLFTVQIRVLRFDDPPPSRQVFRAIKVIERF